MTERELINSAKIFQANCGANGNKVSFADACKVVILSTIEGKVNSNGYIASQAEIYILFELMETYQRPWWKFWKQKSRN
jgi:hypothetical protein